MRSSGETGGGGFGKVDVGVDIAREEAERRELREWQRYDTIVRRQNADALQPLSAMAVDEWHSDLQSESDDTRLSDSML